MDKYKIVALPNTSLETAEQMRTCFCIPEDAKLYADVRAFISDSDVDLIVAPNCASEQTCEFVESNLNGKHTVLPWYPAAVLKNYMVKNGGSFAPRGMVMLPFRMSLAVLQVKSLVALGKIGRVLNSDARIFVQYVEEGKGTKPTVPLQLARLCHTSRPNEMPGITAGFFGSFIDFIHYVLGEFKSFHSKIQIHRAFLHVAHPETKVIINRVQNAGPDFIEVCGRLKEGTGTNVDIAKGASLAVLYRVGQPFPAEKSFTWTIYRDRGQIRMSSPVTPTVVGGCDVVKVQVRVHGEDVESINCDWEEWQMSLGLQARGQMMAGLYDRFSSWWEKGKSDGPQSPPFDVPILLDSLERIKEIETMFAQYDLENGHKGVINPEELELWPALSSMNAMV